MQPAEFNHIHTYVYLKTNINEQLLKYLLKTMKNKYCYSRNKNEIKLN